MSTYIWIAIRSGSNDLELIESSFFCVFEAFLLRYDLAQLGERVPPKSF